MSKKTDNTDLAPIVLFVYNRLEHTKRTISTLEKNKQAVNSDLFIFSDGAKQQKDVEKVNAVRRFLKRVKNFKSVQIKESEENKGLANSIITGVSEIVERYGKVIVLEDDMVSSPYFLTFMNDALDLYYDEEKVACIHAYQYPIGEMNRPFFIRGADCWGWGTWQRAWEGFNPDGKKLIQQLKSQNLISEFNHNNSFPYFQMLVDQAEGKNDSWAIRWKASAFLNKQYTLYYKAALIKNIGNDSTGTHSETSDKFDVDLTELYDGIEKQEIKEDVQASQKIEQFYRSLKPGLWRRVIAKFLSLRK